MPKINPKHLSLRVQRRNAVDAARAGIPFYSHDDRVSPRHRATQQQHMPLLMTIESAIMEVFAEEAGLTDHDVIAALQALIRTYSTPGREAAGGFPLLPELASTVYIAVRSNLAVIGDTRAKPILDSLACILDSARFWTKQNGKRGYLLYVHQFLPS